MSHDDPSDESKPAASGKPRENGYEVGYGRPPKATQFKPGTSGNPEGRPKKIELMHIPNLINAVFMRKIAVRDGEKTRRVPRIVAAMEQLLHRALKGDLAALRECYKIAHAQGVLSIVEEPDIDLSSVQLTKEERDALLAAVVKIRAARMASGGRDLFQRLKK